MPFLPRGGGPGGDPFNYYDPDPTEPPGIGGGGGNLPGGGGALPGRFGGAPARLTFPEAGTLPYARRRRLAGRVLASSQPAYFGPAYGTQAPEYASMFGYGGGPTYGAQPPGYAGGEAIGPIGQPPVTGPGPGQGPGVPGGTGGPSYQPRSRLGRFPAFGQGLGGVPRGTAGARGPGYAKEPIDIFNPLAADPSEYLKRFPGIQDLLNPRGSDTLYNALYGQGISQAGAASRRALVGARARGLGGTPYGLLAAEAERESLGELARNLFGARAESIGRNQEFIGRMAGGYQDFLNALYRERQQYLRERELELLRQQFERGRRRGWTAGIGPVTVGG